ncbi:MAG: hypothetical protein ACE5I7_18370 [Candidatus Binatia bacterium]
MRGQFGRLWAATLCMLLSLPVVARPSPLPPASPTPPPGGTPVPTVVCGELVQGLTCVFLQSDGPDPSSGDLFLLSDRGTFQVGDRVCVTGVPNPECVTVCQQGETCFDVMTIEAAPVPTPGPTRSPSHTIVVPVSPPTPTSTPTPPQVPALCIGDCNRDGTVDVSELITGVNIALGRLPFTTCPAFDCNSQCRPGPVLLTPRIPAVTVSCLIRAVNTALSSCPWVPCRSDEDCDDGNGCSIDRCTPSGCMNQCLCL